MNKLVNRLHSQLLLLNADKSGASAAEYALLISLIAVAIIGATAALGGGIAATLAAVTAAL